MGASQVAVVKNLPANTGDVGLIPESGRSLGVGNSNPLQYSCLENSMDGGAWQAISHGVTRVRHYRATEHRNTGIHVYFQISFFLFLCIDTEEQNKKT